MEAARMEQAAWVETCPTCLCLHEAPYPPAADVECGCGAKWTEQGGWLPPAPGVNPMIDTFGPVISRYTRAQAIADGVLVDLGPALFATEAERENLPAQAGWRYPVACTAAVFEQCIEWERDDNKRQRTVQDVKGRLWDVLCMAALGAKKTEPGQDQFLFELYRVPRDGRTQKPKLTTLKAHVGPGDEREPVVTIMLPNED